MAPDIRTLELREPVDIGEYLVRRLKEVGIQSIHGLPGDFNLRILDYIPEHGLRWVGNVNELNAGYAADGYARIKGIAAVVTTFGVGELSLLNAVAGAYSEFVPIVHIVGTPSTISQRDGLLLHHTLGTGDFHVFTRMSAQISCETTILDNPSTAAALIDHAIRECYLQSRPVYLALPTDLVEKKVEGARLAEPIDLSFSPNDPDREDYVVEVVLRYLYAARRPVILVDACAIRHRALEETHELMAKSGLPVFVTPMGKGGVDETLPTYGGVYAGDGSNPSVRSLVESSDLVLSIGALKSDFNTAGFSYRISQLNTIDFEAEFVRVRYSEYPGIRMNGVIRRITQHLDPSRIHIPIVEVTSPQNLVPATEDQNDPTITQVWFWPRVGSWLRENDLVITETGTSNFGIWETRFPRGVRAISQALWGSIGYANGSCQGAALAAQELGKEEIGRTVLFIGDGAFQLTAQELSTMIRQGLNPIIFIICNNGFAIERLIHGIDKEYNYIQNWKFFKLPVAFGATDEQVSTHQVKSKKEVEELFRQESFSTSNKLRLVEVYMPENDAPAALKITAERAAKRNAQTE